MDWRPLVEGYIVNICGIFSLQRKFLLKSVLNIIYTFYLKHKKYPFFERIFQPISETESYMIK